MSTENERLAVVETEIETLKDNHKEMLKIMHEIKDEMTRYKGFLGGIAFLVSCLGVALTVFKDWIFKHLQ
jgi:hypothetical protein